MGLKGILNLANKLKIKVDYCRKNVFSYMEIQVHISSPLPGQDLTQNSYLLSIRTKSQLCNLIVFSILKLFQKA